uniref:Nudix hydrolase domain-containing protein n=2 Tax=Periophthalmus magnuspinnatus TaxID=409849 RepID=A0A3B3ZJB9_9GOBI
MFTSSFGGHSLFDLDARNIKPFCDFSPKVSGTFLNTERKQWKSTIVRGNNDCTDCVQSRRKLWIQQHCYSYCDPLKPSSLCSRANLTRYFSTSVSKVGIFNHHPIPYKFHQTRQVYKTVPREDCAWRECLSSENEQRCRQILEPNLKLYEVEKVRKGPSLSLGKKQARWASVLISLCSVEEEPAFLFTLRSSTLQGRHKGDVSFAGGKSDPSDKDVVATALREAREELGINVGAEQVWGILKPLREMTGMMVAPVLANLGPLEELSFKPNPGEVEEIFTLSLSHLCNPVNRGYTHFRTGDKYGYTMPVFRNGKHRVWGLTAVALEHTLKIICPP